MGGGSTKGVSVGRGTTISVGVSRGGGTSVGAATAVSVGVAVMVGVGVIVRVAVAVRDGREVTVGGAGLGVTVAGPLRGVRVANAVGVGNGVRVWVGVRVGTGVPLGVGESVGVFVDLGVRVGRGVGVLVGSLVGVRRGAPSIPPGSVGSASVFWPSSIRIGASVLIEMAVGAVRLRRVVSSGARLHACNRTNSASASGKAAARFARA